MFRAGTGPQHYLFLERLNRMTTEKKLQDMAMNRTESSLSRTKGKLLAQGHATSKRWS